MSVALGEEIAYQRSLTPRIRLMLNGGGGSAANATLLGADIAAQAEADFAMIGWEKSASGAGNVVRRFQRAAANIPGARRSRWRRK